MRKETDELTRLLQPIKRRLNRKRLVKYTLFYLWLGLAASLVMLTLARLVPIHYYRELALAILGLALLFALATVYVRRADEGEASAYADSQGLQEQVSTAWEFRQADSPLVRLQREAALYSLREHLAEIKASITLWPYSRQKTMWLGSLALAWWLLFLLPNPLDDTIRLQLEERKAIASMEKELEKEIKEIEQNKELDKLEQEKLANLLEKMKDRLREKDTDKLRTLEEGKLELAKWQQEQEKKLAALEELKRGLAEEKALAQVVNSLDLRDQETLREAMEKLSQLVASLTKEEQEELAQLMEAIARKLEADSRELAEEELTAIAEKLKQAAELLRQGELPGSFAELKQALVRAQEQLTQGAQVNQHLSRALSLLQQGQLSLAQASPSLSGGAVGLGQAGSSGQTSGVTSGNTAAKEGSAAIGSASSTSGQGQGAATEAGEMGQRGSGQKGSSGNNAPGTGHGQGSSAGSGRGGAGAGSGVGQAPGSRELVTVPLQRWAGNSQSSDSVGGPLGEGPSETRWSDAGQVLPGMVRPYEEVFREYEQMARESLERKEIPKDYEELVKQYFSELEPF